MTFRTLISTGELADRLADPALALVDCRFRLDAPDWGARDYERGHIPRAAYAHLDRDLSGPKTGTNGRHPLPDSKALIETLGRLGITNGMQVVAYDQDAGGYASRLWWLLRWLGHDQVAVLDGGFAKWTAEGRPVASGVETPAPRTFVGTPNRAMTVSAEEVRAMLGSRDWTLVDARAPERYAGRVEPIDPVAGHIPGAVNRPFLQNVDASGVFHDPVTLAAEMRQVVGDQSPDRLVCYCGSGVTASHNLLALEHAGLSGAKLYPGSWSEWSSDPERPVEKAQG